MLISGLIIIFLSALTQGLVGFGFALVSVPLLLIFFEPKILIPILLVYAALINIIIIIEGRKSLELKRIWLLTVSGIVGVPVGTYALVSINTDVLKIIIGVLVILFGIVFLKGFKAKIKNEKLIAIPVGIMSGILNGCTTMSGPPVVLYFTNQDVKKQIFRINLAFYFTLLNIGTVPIFLVGGLFNREVINSIFMFLPALLLGVFLGIKFSSRIKEKLFRKIVLIIIILAGSLSVISGLNLL